MEDPVLALIDELIGIEDRVKKLSELADQDRKYALVRLRRDYSDYFARIAEALRTYQTFKSDPALTEEFRGRLSKVRSVAALHQAEWPAVRSDTQLEAYRKSAANLSRANVEFCQWARGALASRPS